MAFELRVEGFDNATVIPRRHTCEGDDLAPALSWSGEPAGTKSFALILDDPDAPVGAWNHWLLWDIPAERHSLAPGFKPGETGQSGANDFGRPGYGGPCPPRGHGPHRYYFKLFALNVPSLGLRAGSKRAALDQALRDHVLAEARYMGRYERK